MFRDFSTHYTSAVFHYLPVLPLSSKSSTVFHHLPVFPLSSSSSSIVHCPLKYLSPLQPRLQHPCVLDIIFRTREQVAINHNEIGALPRFNRPDFLFPEN